jgi:hypothetical protein
MVYNLHSANILGVLFLSVSLSNTFPPLKRVLSTPPWILDSQRVDVEPRVSFFSSLSNWMDRYFIHYNDLLSDARRTLLFSFSFCFKRLNLYSVCFFHGLLKLFSEMFGLFHISIYQTMISTSYFLSCSSLDLYV